MSVRRQLIDSGHFEEVSRQADGTLRFLVRDDETGGTHFGSAIYVQPTDQEVHIRISALENSRFPNNRRLYAFLRHNAQETRHGQGNSSYAYLLPEVHLPRMIELIGASQ